MDGETLFDLFVAHSTTVGEIAAMDLPTLTRQIGELRDKGDDHLPETDDQIATGILGYAWEMLRGAFWHAKDVYSRDPQWPSVPDPDRQERFPTFEEWVLKEHGIVLERSNE